MPCALPGLLLTLLQVRKPPAMSVLLPLPPKPIGDPDSAEQQQQRPPQPGGAGEMAIQQYFGPLKFQKMAAWVQGMAMLTGAGSCSGLLRAVPWVGLV